MNATNGKLYWQKKSNIKNTYNYLTHDMSCDVLIVGGGIVGAITAYFLAKEGANVIVAEKNIVGYGCTSAAIASLSYETDMELCKLEKLIGKQSANKIYQLCYQAIDKIEKIDNEIGKDTGFKRQDSLYFSNKFIQKNAMNKEYTLRKENGYPSNFVNSHELINFSSAILTKNSSAIMNPYLFTQNLFEYLTKLENVFVFENTKIDKIKCGFDEVECVTNNQFKIKAERVIFTSGYDTLKYVKTNVVEPSKIFTIVTKPIEKLKLYRTEFTAKDNAEPYNYMRFDNNKRIFVTGESVKLTEKLMDEQCLQNVAKDRYKKLYHYLRKTFPSLNDVEVDYTFNSTMVYTKDSLPIVDEIPNMPNCFCNLGFGSNGILSAVIGAEMLKDAIRGLYTKEMNMFRLER